MTNAIVAMRSVQRAWQACQLKTHGVPVVFAKRPHDGTDRRGHRRQGGRVDQDGREALERLDLHFHDLRREAGSRWMEGGMPLHVVQQLLGHADARTTSIYLNATRTGLHESMRRFEDFRQSSTNRPQDAAD